MTAADFDAVLTATAPLTERFTAAGHRLYLVGGVVRDQLVGRARGDADLDATTAARPEEIKRIVADVADAVWTQGERFGTIGLRISGQEFEITTHRAEAYDEDSRKPVVTFGDDIADDLARRDFTVNAMAVDAATGEVVDPYGGREDLEARVLRTPLDPETSFSEDPLRMLRAARFHAGYDLAPVPELESAITALLDRMAIVSVERIRDELQKLLLLDAPAAGLALLARTGLLAVVLPKLGHLDWRAAALRGDRVAHMPASPAMRWAALLGPDGLEPGDLSALRFSGALSRDALWFAAAIPWIDDPTLAAPSEPEIRRAAAAAPSERSLEERHEFVRSGRRALDEPTVDVEAVAATLSALRAAEPDLDDPTPLLDGVRIAAVLGIEPGPEIGSATRWLRDLRFDEGPLPEADAIERLLAWWPTRDDG